MRKTAAAVQPEKQIGVYQNVLNMIEFVVMRVLAALTAEFDPPRRADCVLGIPCKAVGSTRGKQVTTTLIDVIRELMNMILISFI